MKNTGKRLFTLLLVLLLAALPSVSLSAAVRGAQDDVLSGTCGAAGDGSNLTWTLRDGVLSINGVGDMADYAEIAGYDDDGDPYYRALPTPWETALTEALYAKYPDAAPYYSPENIAQYSQLYREMLSQMQAVEIGEGVTSVGAYAFSEWRAEFLSLPSTLRTIGAGAFYKMPVRELELPAALESIGEGAFEGARLQSVTVRGNPDLSGLSVPCYTSPAPCLTTNADDAAYELHMLASDLSDCLNVVSQGNIYRATSPELIPDQQTEDAYMEGIFDQMAAELERVVRVPVTSGTAQETADSFVSAINSLLHTSFTTTSIRLPGGMEVCFAPEFLDAVSAYILGSDITSYPAYSIYYKITRLVGGIHIAAEEQKITFEEAQAQFEQRISDVLEQTNAFLDGSEINDVVTAQQTVLELINGDMRTEFTAGETFFYTPVYNVDTEALNAAFDAVFGSGQGSALPRAVSWRTVGDLTEGAAEGHVPAPWFTVLACGHDVLMQAEAAGLSTVSMAHVFDDIPVSEQPATCLEWGTATYACVNCGLEQIVQTDEPNGHLYMMENETLPTCTQDGFRIIRCLSCNDTKRETIPTPGHQTVMVSESAPTYDVHGYTAGEFCTVCQTWISGHEVIHNTYGERTVLQEPTATQEGRVIITCTVCGEQGVYAIEPLGEDPKPPLDDGSNVIDEAVRTIRRAMRGVIDWILRLLAWLGGNG